MAAAPTLSKSHSVSSLSASSPRKDSALKPNPHPYAIKTTSTALLTRSYTSDYNVNATRHYYVPLTPNPTKSDIGKGHRATKSLTSMSESPTREAPRPLPIPPDLETRHEKRSVNGSGGYVSADEVSAPRRRPRRSETMPVISLPTAPLLAPTPAVEELPDNPKLWTPSQLATYLTTALRVTSGGKPGEVESIGLPPLVAKDIAAFVKSARIGGRTFLRMNEEDFEALGMNKKWRQALLAALRNLRQNVLKGRIWGPDGSPSSSPSVESVSPDQFFANPTLNSSSSSIESSSSLSTGEDATIDAPGAVLGRSRARRYKNGRVRGMIETFERSGSFSSDGGLEDGEETLANERANLRRWAQQDGQITGHSAMVDESPSPSRRRPLPIPPAFTGASSGPLVDDEEPTVEALLAQEANSQPIMGARAWEEMDLEPGVTVKRIPSNEHEADVSVDKTFAGSKGVSSLGSGRGSGGSSKGKPERRVVTAIFAPAAAEPPASASLVSSGGVPVEAEAPSRVQHDGGSPVRMLAVFPDKATATIAVAQEQAQSRPLPPLPDLSDAVASLETQEITLHAQVEDDHVEQQRQQQQEPSPLERLLEAEILETRTLLDTFRARLEAVEQKVAEMEAHEAQREHERDAELAARAELASAPAVATAAAEKLHATVEIGVQSTGTMAVVDVQVQSDPSSAATPSLTGAASSANLTSSLEDRSTSPVAGLQAVIPDVVRQLKQSSAGLFSSAPPSYDAAVNGTSAVSRRKRKNDDSDDEPSSVSDLPSYVLLVGLGVCAVVLQVVFRKVVGRGAVSGWKP
ncbi:hypothetical protein C8Q77DRAFT_1155982 [Trametes polyzona]|nr:hypothetical protein C8Q77DRAFT_1155982 [Trametes polyzona]